VTVTSSGGGGRCVADLLKIVDSDVLSRRGDDGPLPPPDAVIVLFDSDAADVFERDQAEQLRDIYWDNLSILLEKLTEEISE